jgi:hypothetical protein
MIHDIIANYHDRDIFDAATSFEAARFKHKQRTYKTGITQESLYEALRDETLIKYFLLEGIAIERDVPLSLLLFYTRLTANQSEDDARSKTFKLLFGFTRVLRDAQNRYGRHHTFTFDDLIRWIDLYRLPFGEGPGETRPVQPDQNQPTFPGFLEGFETPTR